MQDGMASANQKLQKKEEFFIKFVLFDQNKKEKTREFYFFDPKTIYLLQVLNDQFVLDDMVNYSIAIYRIFHDKDEKHRLRFLRQGLDDSNLDSDLKKTGFSLTSSDTFNEDKLVKLRDFFERTNIPFTLESGTFQATIKAVFAIFLTEICLESLN